MKFKDTEYGDLTGKHYEGDIDLVELNITSLEGSPKTVRGDFNCSKNMLKTLAGGPKEVKGYFYCYNNPLTSLIGSPKVVGGDFDCEYTQITSLEGSPEEIGGDFICSRCKLTSLRGVSKWFRGVLRSYGNPNALLKTEWDFRMDNPQMTENEIMTAMYKLTKDPHYLPDAVKKIFLMKDKK